MYDRCHLPDVCGGDEACVALCPVDRPQTPRERVTTPRTFEEIREAYELWVTGCSENGVPETPKPIWDLEFVAFSQGYHFGRMTDAGFTAVTSRLREERAITKEQTDPIQVNTVRLEPAAFDSSPVDNENGSKR